MQSASLAHGVDHQLVDHQDWCQALSAVEHQNGLEASVLQIFVQAPGRFLSPIYFVSVAHQDTGAYRSRAPPLV